MKIWSSFYGSFFLMGIFLCILGENQMSMAKTLVLGDDPLDPSEIETTLDLYSEEKLMGPNLPPKKLAEAEVSIGKHYIHSLPKVEINKSSEPAIRQDTNPKWDYYLIYIPFTLHSPPGNKFYQDLTFSIELANKDATAFDLLPMNITVEEDVKRTYLLSSTLRFQGITGNISLDGKADAGYEVQFKNITPIITAFGQGENKFYWTYESQDGHKVHPGTHHVFIVLEVPHGTDDITGMVYYRGTLYYKWLTEWRYKETKSDYYPVEFDLSTATQLNVSVQRSISKQD